MKIKIIVTAEDIAKASKEKYLASTMSCPIARAARRALDDPEAIVSLAFVHGKRYKYLMPDEARNFVGRFDHRMKVEPFTFVLGRRTFAPRPK